MLMSLAVSGFQFVGADAGGFFGNPDTELLVRWYQAAAFQPFFRVSPRLERGCVPLSPSLSSHTRALALHLSLSLTHPLFLFARRTPTLTLRAASRGSLVTQLPT
jgi:hypothetical protein